LQENDESVANDFFLAGRTLYSIICRREKDGRISAKLTDESRVLSQQFSFDDAENISRIVGEKFHELSENARAYNEKLPVKKGTRRQEVSVWRPEIGKRVVYSIKCRKKEDGFFSIEASKVLGSGFSKVVPRCLDVAESCFTHVLMKLIKSPTPLTDVQRRERSENLRRELGYMMLFHKDPEFVHCHKILVKPHQFKEGSVELVRGAWVEECDGGNLLSFLNSRAFLSDSMRLDFAIAAARGLVKMHGKKLCHGDIKSANFLLKTEGGKLTLKISDFGSTKPFGEKGVLSDRQYAPPEYGPNSLATPQQDTYSLGLSLLELYLGPQANPMGEAVAILRSVLVQDALKKSEKARPSPAVGYYGGHRSKDGDRPAEVSKESQSDKILGEGYANVEKKRVEMERSPNPSLRLISRMLHRDPNDRPSMEEVLEELVAIKNQLEGREGVL
jgi:serine/threonine protein kinase